MRPLLLACAAALLAAPALAAQEPVNAALGWKTITTTNFRIHFEPGLETWSESLAERIEQMREIVAARVGFATEGIVDVIVEDPLNQPNGSAWPSLPVPSMRFWATPPDPGSVIGHLTDWGGLLGIHEYAHIAHLTRPSRNARVRFLWSLSPVTLGPVAIKSPAWVTEGYATLIEGELTGSGRPNGVARPAIIRQWALEGALPTYGMLNSAAPFLGGSMRYLVGSAYLEWLQAQRGDSSLVHLWRRLSARQDRTFDLAFTGVFGESPSVLYKRWVAEVTAQAADAQRALETQGLASGALRQHFLWSVGAPALSADGEKVALRLSGGPDRPTRVVVFETKPSPPDSNVLKARARMIERDSLDVLPIDVYPWPLKRLATLMPVAGVGFDAPRWIPGTDDLLVVRSTRLADGRARNDVYRWNTESGALRRVTARAGVREVDPLPDGRSAAGVSCGAGTCGLVMIDLASGAVRTLRAGTVAQPLAGARVSPDGKRVATSIARDGLWRIAVVDIASGALQEVGPADGQSRWAPTWEGDSALLAVSDASGVANIERLLLGSTAVPQQLTRVTGSATAPDRASDGRIWFLDLHSRGYDLRAIAPDSFAPRATGRAFLASMGAAAPRRDTTRMVELVPRPVAAAAAYGVGPLAVRPMYTSNTSTEGTANGIALQLNDVLGRLSVQAHGAWGSGGVTRGAQLAAVWRGTRPAILASGFAVEQRPSTQWESSGSAVSEFDMRYSGGTLGAELERSSLHGGSRAQLLASAGRLVRTAGLPGLEDTDRTLVTAGYSARYLWSPGGVRRIRNAIDVHHTAGRTDGTAWQRSVGRVMYSFGSVSNELLALDGTYGTVNAAAPVFEQFTIGGTTAGLVPDALLTQRFVRPGLPFATVRGRNAASLRASTGGALRFYHEWYGAGEDPLEAVRRMAGFVFEMGVPAIPAMRTPDVTFSTGALYTFDGPWAKQVGGHLSITIAP